MCFLHAIWRFMNPGLRVVFFSLVSGPQFRVSKSMSLETLTLMWLIWRIVGLYIHDYSSRFVRFCWRLEKIVSSSQVFLDSAETMGRQFVLFFTAKETEQMNTHELYTYTGWWFGSIFIVPFSWECHNPNWRTLSLYIYMIEGSLEVKLPTIWTDEKQSRAEAERRERFL